MLQNYAYLQLAQGRETPALGRTAFRKTIGGNPQGRAYPKSLAALLPAVARK